MIKNLMPLIALALIILVSACAQSPQGNNQPPQTGNNVAIKNSAFEPSQITVKLGDTIVWTNEDSAPHTITSDTGNELASQSLSLGGTYSHTFNTAGTYDYHCSIHTFMKGKVIVE